jgi:hypothetical protein
MKSQKENSARMPVPKFIRELVFVTGSLGSRMTV